MKNLLGILVLLMSFGLANAQSVATIDVKKPAVASEILLLKETGYEFGKILQGRPVFHEFEVRNTGKEALQIENVQTSCGCTTPEWSREAIAPGATTIIKVGYNAAAEGPFTKSITLSYNGNQTKNIIISGVVYKAPATSAPVNSSVSLLKQINH